MNSIIPMQVYKECKHSVRYSTADPEAAVADVYVRRSALPQPIPQEITVTVQVEGGQNGGQQA